MEVSIPNGLPRLFRPDSAFGTSTKDSFNPERASQAIPTLFLLIQRAIQSFNPERASQAIPTYDYSKTDELLHSFNPERASQAIPTSHVRELMTQ